MTDNMMKVTLKIILKTPIFAIDQRLYKLIKHTYKVAIYAIIKT